MQKSILKKFSAWGLMKEYKKLFVIYFVLIFLGIFMATYLIGVTPNEFQLAPSSQKVEETLGVSQFGYGQQDNGILPMHVHIEKIGVDSTIEHPQSQEVAVLDEALKKGAVYYPGSGTLSQGNVFLFGHSTNHTVVYNKAYKTFNGFKDLIAGDEIQVQGDDNKTYIYKVVKVSLLNDDQALVQFNTDRRMLTLSTCNTFGEKQQRYVVEAQFDHVAN